MDIEGIVKKLKKYDKAYHTMGKPLVSDDEYDLLKQNLEDIDPDNKYLTESIGAPPINKMKKTLPYPLASLDKKKDSKQIEKWISKYPNGPYTLSDKLDGISALYLPKSNQLFTRGDGLIGSDISHILKYIQHIPTQVTNDVIAVRGELLISKDDWQKIKSVGSNARNVVAGLANAKSPNIEILKHVQFIAYSLLEPVIEHNKSLKMLEKAEFKTVFFEISQNINVETLSEFLIKRKNNSEFEVDGIVASDSSIPYQNNTNKNPEFAFAFKSIITQKSAEVIVKNIVWNVSKDGLYKPTIEFDPVVIDNVVIKKTTGFNAAYIRDNNIGLASRLIIIRSGDVIPYIKEVKTSGTKNLFPEKYVWDENGIDILSETTDNTKVILHFMKTLEIKHVAQGTIQKLYEAGFDTIIKFVNITKDEIMKIDGFQSKSADNIIESLKNISKAPIEKIMAGTNIFGRGLGIKKLKSIIDKFPDIITKKYSIQDIQSVDGIGSISAQHFLSHIDEFIIFWNDLNIPMPINTNDNKRIDKTIVFTGFRDKNLQSQIENLGGVVSDTVTNKTKLVIAKSIEDSTKIQKAKKLDIPIILKDDFEIEKFMTL
jgi:NAD-dependent DNA ligase